VLLGERERRFGIWSLADDFDARASQHRPHAQPDEFLRVGVTGLDFLYQRI
jgi:hypothetical protein